MLTCLTNCCMICEVAAVPHDGLDSCQRPENIRGTSLSAILNVSDTTGGRGSAGLECLCCSQKAMRIRELTDATYSRLFPLKGQVIMVVAKNATFLGLCPETPARFIKHQPSILCPLILTAFRHELPPLSSYLMPTSLMVGRGSTLLLWSR